MKLLRHGPAGAEKPGILHTDGTVRDLSAVVPDIGGTVLSDAGLAAIRAAELGARTVLLEKNRRAGVKILMSGGTRCNITNARGLRNLNVVSA